MTTPNRRRISRSSYPVAYGQHPFEYMFNGWSPDIRPVADLLRTDIEENENEYSFFIDMPGIKKEGINLEYADGYLVVEATNAEETEENGEKKYVCKERNCGFKKRSFYVGTEVDEDNIKAKYEQGVLNVIVPKKAPVPPEEAKRQIPID